MNSPASKTAKAQQIEELLDLVLSDFMVLPMDAINYDLTVVTRKVTAFRPFNVPLLNPFKPKS